MKRWLAAAAALSAVTPVLAQPPGAKTNPGMAVIRMRGSAGPAAAPPMPNQPQDPSADFRSVVAVVPFSNVYTDVVYAGKQANPITNPMRQWIKSDFGKTLLFADASRIQLEILTPNPQTPQLNPDTIVKARHAEWQKTRGPKALLDLIALALGHDQVETAFAYAAELQKAVDARKDPPAPPEEVNEFLAAFKDLQAKLDTDLPADPAAEEWKKRLQATAKAEEKHYTVLHYGDQSLSAEALGYKTAELERNFRAFYLWHAVSRQKAGFPARKQVVVVAKKAAEMANLRVQLEGSPVVADAFYSPVHNIVVISPERLDDNGRSYLEGLRAEYDSGIWSRESLLKGKSPVADARVKFDDIFRMSVNAVVDRAMEAEVNHGAASREGSRQLFVAAGAVPQHVVLPRWADAGMANLLSKPKNPGVLIAATGEGRMMACGYASGYGTPNYVLFREWKTMKARGELAIGSAFAAESDTNKALAARDMLLAVLTDQYFGAAAAGIDLDKVIVAKLTPPPPPTVPPGGMPPQSSSRMRMQQPGNPPPSGNPNDPPPPNRVRLNDKAQATAWSLAYFLAKQRPDGWVRYMAELSRLPRDMRLDRKMSLEAFARAFSLMTPDLTGLDGDAIKAFAMTWIGFLEAAPDSWRDVPVVAGPG